MFSWPKVLIMDISGIMERLQLKGGQYFSDWYVKACNLVVMCKDNAVDSINP